VLEEVHARSLGISITIEPVEKVAAGPEVAAGSAVDPIPSESCALDSRLSLIGKRGALCCRVRRHRSLSKTGVSYSSQSADTSRSSCMPATSRLYA